jgi:hypothetical protein
MKTKHQPLSFISVLLVMLVPVFISCDKDDFTIENKAVSGDFTYTMTNFIPLSFDSTGTIPLSARITMEGPGTVSDLGNLFISSTFKFDFITGIGSEFVNTLTGDDPGDTIESTTSSQRQFDGTIIVTDQITSGTGKFSKIAGGGTTLVTLNAAGDAGTGVLTWTVTY